MDNADQETSSQALRSWLLGCAVLPIVFGLTLYFRGLPGQLQTPPRFWLGVLHGFVAPCSFVVSLFANVRMYDPANVTRWYDFGFLLGAVMSFVQCIPGPAPSPEEQRIKGMNRVLRRMERASPWNHR